MLDKAVYVTKKIPEEGIDLLREHIRNVTVNPESRILTKNELIRIIRDCDGVLAMLTNTFDEEFFASAEKVKVIANYAVGYNNVDLSAATRRGVMITNTPGVLTDATSDMVWALLFAVARRIVEADHFTHEGKFAGWEPMLFLGEDITGMTLGILGAGRIGTAVALKSAGFRMRVLYCDPQPNRILEEQLQAEHVELKTLLRESDFLSINVFLSPENIHFIGEKELQLMKKKAFIINTSRGQVVDEKALVTALREGWIAGAGLDVYEDEPILASGLTELPNAVICPHIASGTHQTRIKMSLMAAENIVAALQGNVPPNLVNTELVR